METERKQRVGLLSATGILVVVFLVAGMMKALALEPVVEMFQLWGYPLWFMYLVGAAEIILALGLLAEPTRFYASSLLIAEMIGAFGTHIVAEQWAFLIAPVVMGTLAGFVAVYSAPRRVERALRGEPMRT